MKRRVSLFLRAKKNRREGLAMVRRVTRDAHVYNRIAPKTALWDGCVFLALTIALSIIAFLGRPPHTPSVRLNQRPRFTAEARFDFTYESEADLAARRMNAAAAVLPSFRVDTEGLQELLARYRAFGKALAGARDALAAQPPDMRESRIREMPEMQALPGVPKLVSRAASTAVAASSSAGALEYLFNDAIPIFEGYHQRGLYDENTFNGGGGGDSAIRLIRRDVRRREMSIVEARQMLYQDLRIQALGDAGNSRVEQEGARTLARAVAEIFQPGLTPDIRYDADATGRAREAARAAEQPVPIEVKKDTPLISRDIEVGPATLERWKAYRAAVVKHEAMEFGLTRTFVTNTLWGLAIMALVVLYSRVAAPPGPRRKRAMSLVALCAILNLALLRLAFALAESGQGGFEEVLRWCAPWTLAPLLVVILAGPHMAIVAALLVSGFAAAMNGNNLHVMLASLLASLVAIRIARGVRLRARIVSAGVLSGIPVALVAFYGNASAADWLRPATFAIPAATLLAGLLTGVVATGLLPYLENLFKTTTDITLIELTDYNHPLLRKLQILAPGTFHHSVMVANIAERAAEDIGANALFCRCAALFHDIGKMAKPEYFIENQRPGPSPHAGLSPSMSALVIKSHVREGVEIAREYRLPRVVIEIIEQHHGTGLITYFFHKACKAAETEVCARLRAAAGSDVADAAVERAVDESGFRYDGPKPQTREAAVILLADSVEAASRSLKTVTPQTVEDLVDAIVSDRIEDGQLDECPLSFRDIRKLRTSLRQSLLTSLHQRVEYPAGTPKPASRNPAAPEGV